MPNSALPYASALVLAYHADDEIARVREEWLIILLAVLAAVILALLAQRRTAGESGPNWPSRTAIALAVVLAPFAVLAPLLFVLPPLWFPPATAIGLAAAGLLRRPAREPRLAILAFALAGLVVAWAMSETAACLATDACFH